MELRDQKLVEQKLASLQKYLAEIRPYLRGSAEQFERDATRRRAVERLTQVIVECAIDTNNLVIQSVDLPPAESAKETFRQLKQQGILNDYVTNRYVEKYVGLRNVIVHLYEKIEPKTLFYSTKRLVRDSEEYTRQIQKFLLARSRR